jgi:hypothetical protein
MTLAAAALALAHGSADLVAGLLIGSGLGFLAGPVVRHLLAVREWAAASREARLTDELIARLPDVTVPPSDADDGGRGSGELRTVDGSVRPAVRWRTSR